MTSLLRGMRSTAVLQLLPSLKELDIPIEKSFCSTANSEQTKNKQADNHSPRVHSFVAMSTKRVVSVLSNCVK